MRNCPLQSDPGEVGAAVKTAIDVGYRHLDCTWLYKNEAEIGETLKEKFDDGTVKREDLFITSKVAYILHMTIDFIIIFINFKVWRTKMRYDDCLDSVKKSINDLKVGYLDLCLVHWPISMPVRAQ